jgi:hypothetical protein
MSRGGSRADRYQRAAPAALLGMSSPDTRPLPSDEEELSSPPPPVTTTPVEPEPES